MVLPSVGERRLTTRSSVSTVLVRLCLVTVLIIVYLVSSVSESPSQHNEHWKPPILDWLLGHSQDDEYAATASDTRSKGLPMNPSFSEGLNDSNNTDINGPINVPQAKSKLKPQKLGHGSTKYLGIMIDAGRHHFSINWIKALLDYMVSLGYNVLHLRLTDDQAFNLQLNNQQDDFSMPAPFYDRTYTVQELHQLVTYARKLKITVIPEINLPGHAASWPQDVLVPCPKFICTYGYAIPLNPSSPKLLPLVRKILTTVKDIFGTHWLHLGGDELEQAEGCFKEAGLKPDYAAFEEALKIMVKDELGFETVIRWERPSDSNSTLPSTPRTHDMTQYWIKSIDDYSELPSESFFSSAGLYMDVNRDDNAWIIYQETQKNIRHSPQGIIIGTFELGMEWWMDRNVFGRMMAVSMAFASTDYDEEPVFVEAYKKQCEKLVGRDSPLCDRQGAPLIPYSTWRGEQWDKRFNDWKVRVCARLTEPFEERVMLTVNPISDKYPTRQAEEIAVARKIFIHRLQKRQNKPMPPNLFLKNKYGKFAVNKEAYFYPPFPNREAMFTHKVGHTGVTVDLTRYFFPPERLRELIERMSLLGFNTLHLRLVDDFSFAVTTKTHPDVAWATRQGGPVYTYKGFQDLIQYAHSLSVEIFPEINVVARAGGWFAAGFLAPCPNHICEKGYGIPLNLTNIPILAVVSNLIEEFRLSFNSPFFHLGYDERFESRPCLKEADINLDFDVIEKKILALLAVLEIPSSLVLRWETSEDAQPFTPRTRAGTITHYQYKNPPADAQDPFFVSTDLRFDKDDDDAFMIYSKARTYSDLEHVLGVLAGTLEMSPQAWNGRNIEGKLIALAMGLSSEKEMDESEFKVAYKKTCGELHMEGDVVNLFGKSRWSEERWQDELRNERQRRSNLTCTRMTGIIPSRKMKYKVGLDI
jgi:hypothetical protein